MHYRLVKTILTVLIILICTVALIGAKYYVKTVESFKSFYNHSKIRLISMQNDGYTEIKKSLDQKYTDKFVKILNEISLEFKSGISNVLGGEYILLSEEFETTLNSFNSKKSAFINTEEYQLAITELNDIKSKIDGETEENKDKYLDEFRLAVNKISTLNTKLNNQLKPERERLDSIKGEVKKLFLKSAKDLISLRTNLMNSTRLKLSSLLKDYAFELNEIKDTFSVDDKGVEYPFDIYSMSNFMIAGKLESECYAEILDDDKSNSVIVSENPSQILS